MKTNKWIWLVMIVGLVGVLFMTSQFGSKKLEITEHISSEEVQSIEIMNDSWDIEVKESIDNQVYVDITGKQKDKKKAPVVVTHKDNQLIIQQHKQIGGAFSAFTFEKEGTITILIPKNTVEQVTLINNEGDLNIQTLATQKLTLQNQAGNVKFNQVEASVLNVFSKNGEIVIKRVDEKGEMNVETETGDIQVAYQNAPSSLKVAVENAKGDTTVNLANLSTTKNTDAEVHGTIGAGENSLHVKSYSGSIGIK
ncbi:DUF4097 family beta strand repeat-containing protein [Paenibacillus sp. IHBB 10380]|uniref:DUF4097 family beta strand repeat-containing protein n=1 Tax=Paenibacillus sp. IHBB 10380 TaxID=1566358 RepID=UPI0005CFC34C|nr:DUF4097 family beta strand repeat-containing protein [Paenibacillus sp. IHBB 10380]AJS58251.1 hypothetical protein UB51_06800 [Paenibacillus sp. IHBB 10380]